MIQEHIIPSFFVITSTKMHIAYSTALNSLLCGFSSHRWEFTYNSWIGSWRGASHPIYIDLYLIPLALFVN